MTATTRSEAGRDPESNDGLRGPDGVDWLRDACQADELFRSRYDGWELLARSASGVIVVRTHLRDADLPVVVKMRWGGGEQERLAVRREGQALMRVRHACVVHGHTVFDRGELAWIEMECVHGIGLGEALRQRRASGVTGPFPGALEIGICVAEGLAAVHARGLVHRDVKPDNVLLSTGLGPRAKLADFGVARALDATTVLDERLPGSPHYAAPEGIRGQPLSPASDVYGLGLTLYELLSGGLNPFGLRDDASLARILECQLNRFPAPLRVVAPGLPDHVVDVVHAALCKAPERRPSAAAVAAALRGPSIAEPAPGRRVLFQAVLVAAALGVVAGGMAGATGAWLLLR